MSTTEVKNKGGRKRGYLTPSSVRKIAVKTLQNIIMDDVSSAEAKAIAATTLLQEIPR